MRDQFRDWNLYHKSIVILLAAMAFGVIVRAVLVFDTAFEVTDERMINARAETVWALISTDKSRDKWQAELMDLVELTGPTNQTGSTRLVFWKRDLNRWQSVERTQNILPGRVLNLIQTSDQDTRWVSIALKVAGPCQTYLTIEEIIAPSAYKDRFWFFSQRAEHEERLLASLDAMERWATVDDPNC